MKCLDRNKQTFYYADFVGKEAVRDTDGNRTGEYETVYTKPHIYRANISAAVGETVFQNFGSNELYDKVIVSDLSLKLNEHSVLWIDTLPVFNSDGTTNTPHDYIVKKVAKSLNNCSFAIRKVNVNEN